MPLRTNKYFATPQIKRRSAPLNPMTVAQYQKMDDINSIITDDFERLGWIVCNVFSLTHDEVNAMPPARFAQFVTAIEKRAAAKPSKFGRVKFQTDAAKITLGQFIECQHWLKDRPILCMHMVAASLLFKRTNHQADAAKIRNKQFNQVLPGVLKFVDSMNKMLLRYKGLFEIDEQAEPDAEKEKEHPFIQQYGWIFSAKELAAYEGVTLDKAFELPVLQAFNGLAYLKSKAQFIKWQTKK